MGFYTNFIFPHVLDWAMQRASIAEQRPLILSQVRGPAILEIGCGTGLNLPHYPADVRHLTVVEPNSRSLRRAERRAFAAGVHLTRINLTTGGRDIDAPDAAFDTVVSTWTLCTIPDPARALAEVYRVLKPGGRFVFVEHGLSPEPHVARWQHRLNPINRLLGDGCNLNRDVEALVRGSPLAVERCETFYARDTPKVGGYTYRGVAVRS